MDFESPGLDCGLGLVQKLRMVAEDSQGKEHEAAFGGGERVRKKGCLGCPDSSENQCEWFIQSNPYQNLIYRFSLVFKM